MPNKAVFTFLCICAIALFSGSVLAQNTFNVANGNWNNPANWSAGHVPNGTENLAITAGDVCTMDVNYTGNGTYTLTVSGTLQIPSGITLSTPKATVILNANNATLSGGGTVTLSVLTINTTNSTDAVSITNSTVAAPISIGIGNAVGTLNLTNGILELPGQVLGFTKFGTINVTGSSNFANSADGISGDVDANGGTVDFLGSSGANVNINNAPTFYNLTVPTGNLQFNFGSTGNARINGTFSVPTDGNQFNAAGNPLIWGPNSTLSFYANGQWHANQYLNTLWSAIGTSTIGVTAGYPNNVTLLNVPANTTIADNQNINGTLTLGDGTSGNRVNGFVLGTDFSCAGLVTTANSILDNVTNLTLDGTAPCNIPNILSVSSATVITNLTITNSANVILNSPVNVSGIFTLTSGALQTSSANILNITNTAANAITGAGIGAGSSINGPVTWSVASGAGTYLFPVSSGTDGPCPALYLPLTLYKAASSAATVTVQAIGQSGSGGVVDATLSSLSTTEYWSFSTTSSLTGSAISLARPTPIAPLALIGESTVANGTYTSIGGTAVTDGVDSSTSIGSGTSLFFTLGVPPIVSTLAATSITTTSATLNGAFNTQGTSLPTTFNYGLTTSYGSSITSQNSPINSNSSIPDSAALTGLTANTLYHYIATDGVNSGSDVTFITAPNPPTVGTPTSPTADGFTANWSAPAVPGTAAYTYTVEVSTDPTFATDTTTQTGIPSSNTSFTFNTLASATTYYYRVEAVNATANSVWSATSAGISTEIFPTQPCTTGNGSTTSTGSITKALSLPVIDGLVDPVWAGVPPNPITNVSVGNSTGNTQTWKAMWSADSLYFLIQVTDPTLISQDLGLVGSTTVAGATPSTSGLYYGSDGVEITLAPDGILTPTYNGYNDVQFRFNLGSTIVSGQSSGTANQFTGAIFNSVYTNVDFRVVVSPGGYTVEAAIPLAPGIDSLQAGGYFPPTVGQNIGLEVQVNDATAPGGRAAQYSWFNTANNPYNDPQEFAEATYTTCPIPPTVILPTVTNITDSSAILGATVSSSGDTTLTANGTGYTVGPINTGTDSALAASTVVTPPSAYTTPRAGLAPQTEYYFLGYANNANNETGVSNVDSFFTLSALPTIQPTITPSACSQLILNWNAINFPSADSATNTGYLVLRSVSPAVPSTTGITTRVATTQSALSPGTTLVGTISSGSTLTFTDATAVTGTTYNYLLVPFTWNGVTADSTYNYFIIGANSIAATLGGSSAAPTVVATQPACNAPTGTITVTSPTSGVTYSFNGGASYENTASIDTVPGTYNVQVQTTGGCVSADTSITLISAITPIVSITSSAGSTPIQVGDTVSLVGSSIPVGETYSWTSSTNALIFNTTSASTETTPTVNPTIYTLTVTDTAGCVGTGTDTVFVNQLPCTVIVPNAFAPGSSYNLWVIGGGDCTTSKEVDVYNRWGGLVYHSDNYANDWDGTYKGKALPDATYYYVVKAHFGNNTTETLTGNVTIIR